MLSTRGGGRLNYVGTRFVALEHTSSKKNCLSIIYSLPPLILILYYMHPSVYKKCSRKFVFHSDRCLGTRAKCKKTEWRHTLISLQRGRVVTWFMELNSSKLSVCLNRFKWERPWKQLHL